MGQCAGGGECDVQNPDFGNSSRGLGFEGQGDSCAQQLCHLSLSQHCAQIPGLAGTQGFSLLLPHIVCWCSRLPVEMPARVGIFHFITMSLMFSRHLGCCLCLLFGCIPALGWSGEYLHSVLFRDRACSHLSSCCSDAWLPAWQTLGCRLGQAGGFCHKTTPGCEQK